MKRSTRPKNSSSKIATRSTSAKPARLLASSIAAMCALVLIPNSGSAQTWNAVPTDGIWNNAVNWTPANVPDSLGETAIFDASTITNLTVTSFIEIDGITFNVAAPAYVIGNTDGIVIDGPGIVNNSANIQTIRNIGGSTLDFFGPASAANSVLNNVSGTTFLSFFDTSTAATSTINNQSTQAVVAFFDNSTLANATINNSANGFFPSSNVSFFANSTAGSGIILNSGTNTQTIFGADSTAGAATINNSGSGSSTIFSGNATGGTATISNSGTDSFIEFAGNTSAGASTLNNSGNGALLEFFNNATAGTAVLNNSSSTGLINFFDNSTAGAATINNSGGGAFPAAIVTFFGDSRAGTSTINNSGANTQTLFSDNASALNSQINNTGSGASSIFIVNSTAGASTINNSGSDTFTSFSGTSTAGTSTLNNSGNGSLIEFFDTATAGNAILNNTNATGLINFFDNSTAGASTINNSGGGAFPPAIVTFFGNSRAGTSTINNSGVNTQTLFSDNASALTARIENTGAGASSIFIINSSAANSLINNTAADTFTTFAGTSTAGASTINNTGAGTLIEFFDTATAGTAILNNTNASGLINFFDSSTAAGSRINNSGGGAFPAAVVGFFNTSQAGASTITNSGANSQTFFSDNASAGTAIINNTGNAASTLFSVDSTALNSRIENSGVDSFTRFAGQSRAANATIINSGDGSVIDFADNSNAGQSTLVNTDPTAIINFLDSSSAGSATINNNGSGGFPSSLVGFFNNSRASTARINNTGDGSQTLFSDDSTAGAAVIVNAGVESSTLFVVDSTAANASIFNSGTDSSTEFNGSSTAANATITNSGDGSVTIFAGNSSGGASRLINDNATSVIDLSQLGTPGTTAGSIEGNGSLRLGSKTLTVGSINLSTIFSGDITDGGIAGGTGGALVKVGSGVLTLSGANTFTGGTTLQAGSILVGSVQALGNGNFTLNNGTLAATGATRDINVRGNYTQNGGTVQFRIGGAAVGQYDRLAVVGKATLSGRLSVQTVNGFNPQADNRFFVVNATGGVSGEFAEFQDGLSRGALTFGITYDANNVILEVLQNAFLPFALTPNQRAVARALDQVVNDPNAVDLIGFLDTLTAAALPAAFDRIAPEEFGAIFEISRSAAKVQAFTIQRRLDEIHASVGGQLPPVLAYDGKGTVESSGKDGKAIIASPRRFGVYANGNGEFVSIGSTSNARGYDFDSGGFTLGFDYLVTDNFVVGALFNYTRTDGELNNGGSIESDAVRGGIYASIFGGGAYFNAYLGGGYNDYDTRRAGLQGTARGNTDGAEFNAFLSTGYDVHIGHLTIGPIASYHFTSTDVDSFRESGSLAPLRIDSAEGKSSRTNLGARASFNWNLGGVVLVPEIRATWQHEFGDVEQTIDARFAFGGPGFSVNSARVGRDSLQLATGFSLQLTPDFAAYVYYDGELGRSNYDAHNVIGGVRASF